MGQQRLHQSSFNILMHANWTVEDRLSAFHRYDYISNLDDNLVFDHINNTKFKYVTIQMQFMGYTEYV